MVLVDGLGQCHDAALMGDDVVAVYKCCRPFDVPENVLGQLKGNGKACIDMLDVFLITNCLLEGNWNLKKGSYPGRRRVNLAVGISVPAHEAYDCAISPLDINFIHQSHDLTSGFFCRPQPSYSRFLCGSQGHTIMVHERVNPGLYLFLFSLFSHDQRISNMLYAVRWKPVSVFPEYSLWTLDANIPP